MVWLGPAFTVGAWLPVAPFANSIQLIFHGYNRVQAIAANKAVNRNRALGAGEEESDAASIVRELRSLRDATLLSTPR